GKNSEVNYQPSRTENKLDVASNKFVENKVAATTTQSKIRKTNDFKQAGEFYRSLDESNKNNLISNLSGDLAQVKNRDVTKIMVGYFYLADSDFGKRLAKALNLSREDVESIMMKK
ncbi:MAG: catalase, partial [Cyclobacteriaceae bacterium]|nr:catalase [Cyclobacteriaceae bacterium]